MLAILALCHPLTASPNHTPLRVLLQRNRRKTTIRIILYNPSLMLDMSENIY